MRKLFFYLLISLLIFNPAFAIVMPRNLSAPSSCQAITFHDPKSALPELKLSTQVMTAVIQIKFNEESCTAQYISDKGHILTASHCAERCSGAHLQNDFFPLRSFQPCLLNINGKNKYYRVVWARRCNEAQRYQISERIRAQIKLTEFDEACIKSPDIAILRPVEPETENFNCLNINTRTPKLNEPVFALGFPQITSRNSSTSNFDQLQKGDAPGNQLVASFGKTVKQNYCENKDGPSYTRKKIFQKHHEKINENFIQTTVDVARGSSGSALINTDGDIVGVASYLTLPEHQLSSECVGNSFFSPISTQKNNLTESVEANFDWSQISCKDKAAFKKQNTENSRLF
jgi:hypothetical protein